MDHRADDWAGRDRDLADEGLCWSLSRLVFLGARTFLALRRRDGGRVDVGEWRALLLREAPELAEPRAPVPSPQLPLFDQEVSRTERTRSPAASRELLLTWLWEALGSRSPLQWDRPPELEAPVSVLPAGSRFRFELVGRVRTDVSAVVEAALLMKVGRRGHFTCLPVATRITFEDGRPSVGVATLNEAYTHVSTLYETERRSHTGNVYEKVLWVNDDDPSRAVRSENLEGERLTRLKYIRDAVALGTWRSP